MPNTPPNTPLNPSAAAVLVRTLSARQALQRTARVQAVIAADSFEEVLRLEDELAAAWPPGLVAPQLELTWRLAGDGSPAPDLQLTAFDSAGRRLATQDGGAPSHG